jgi:hypothetical protein
MRRWKDRMQWIFKHYSDMMWPCLGLFRLGISGKVLKTLEWTHSVPQSSWRFLLVEHQLVTQE